METVSYTHLNVLLIIERITLILNAHLRYGTKYKSNK